jgi:xylose isomerase
MNLQDTTAIMAVLIEQGGFTTGGLNFDCKVRRESVDPIDLFIGHIAAMDCYAAGLRKAAQMYEDGTLRQMVKDRYASWTTTALGQKVEAGVATLEECAAYAAEQQSGEPKLTSGKQELYEAIRNRFLYS